jgi:hypothetical protein
MRVISNDVRINLRAVVKLKIVPSMLYGRTRLRVRDVHPPDAMNKILISSQFP